MASSQRGSSGFSSSANVNLYCTQCETQIGIFNNEWIRLTSSYARSKEKGIHFGTEVGQRTQVVPGGPMPRAAEGCEMAEVFCRKCSNMVGQYCKKAPDDSKQHLVDQYFYKLSRTFLKNSQTNAKVEPIFGYSPDMSESTPGSRPGTERRTSMTPTSRWLHTPLREASRTPSVQTATRSALRNQSAASLRYEKPPTLPSDGVDENDDPSQQAMDILKQELAAQNSLLREHSTKISKQAGQVSDHEARLRDQDARVEDQERCIRAQASRILEQDDIIDGQRTTINTHEDNLATLSTQLSTLQSSMEDLRSSIREVRSNHTLQPYSGPQQVGFLDGFESMVRAMKDAQSLTQEMQTLRAHNQNLQSRLDSILGAMGTGANGDQHDEEVSHSALGSAQVLGKRKRDVPASNNAPSQSLEHTSETEKRLVRFDDSNTNEAPIPQPISTHSPATGNMSIISSAFFDHAGQPPPLVSEPLDATSRHQAIQSADVPNRNSDEKSPIDRMSTPQSKGMGVQETLRMQRILESSKYYYASTDHVPTPESLPQKTHTQVATTPGTLTNNGVTLAEDSPEVPSRMTTRASAKASRQEDRSRSQGLSRSTSGVQSLPASPESFEALQTSDQSDNPQEESQLPSVQAAGEVLRMESEPLQAITLNPNSQLGPGPMPAYQPAPKSLLLESSGTLPASFGGPGVANRTPAPPEPQTSAQSVDQPANGAATSQPASASKTTSVQADSAFDNNVEFSDDDGNDIDFRNDEDDAANTAAKAGESHVSTGQDASRRVTDIWIDREKRSMAPEPAKRRKTVSNTGPKLLSLDRVRIATPQTWADDLSKGVSPNPVRPPPINRRDLDLQQELTKLGLAEWIHKDKKSKEYRDIVAAARAKYRAERMAEVLQAKGLAHGNAQPSSTVPQQVVGVSAIATNTTILSTLDNLPAMPAQRSNANIEDENSQTLHSADGKANEVRTRGDQEDQVVPRVTRARARQSSVASNIGRGTTDQSLSSTIADAEQPSRKRGRLRKSDLGSSATTLPDVGQSAKVLQGILTELSNTTWEPPAQSQADQRVAPETQTQAPVHAQLRELQGSVATGGDNTSTHEATTAPVEAIDAHTALHGAIPFPPQRQKLLDGMRNRAQQKEEAIAARDLLAKQAMEAMEREDL